MTVAPVPPRDAASLLVVRPGPAVLMGMRGAGHRFMPSRLVFPGGAVDRADSLAACATPLRPYTEAALARTGDARLAHALAIAAARELHEETGLSLGMPPRLDGLAYLCRAVTPADSPIRFDARFLVVDHSAVSGELAGSGELEELRWLELADALALDMAPGLAPVTQGVLRHLLDWLALPNETRRSRPVTPVCLERSWSLE